MRLDDDRPNAKLTKRRKRMVALELAGHFIMKGWSECEKPKYLTEDEWVQVCYELNDVAASLIRKARPMREKEYGY